MSADPDDRCRPMAGPAADGDEDNGLPCAHGLLAATMALMTGHALPAPDARVDEATLRRLTARKIVSNLFFLQHHPDLPPGLRQVAAQLHARWQPLAHPAPPAASPEVPATVLH